MTRSFKFEKAADRKEMPGGVLRRLTKEMFPELKDIALNSVQLSPEQLENHTFIQTVPSLIM